MNNVIQGKKSVTDSQKHIGINVDPSNFSDLINSLRDRTPSKTKPILREGKRNYINGSSILEL